MFAIEPEDDTTRNGEGILVEIPTEGLLDLT